MSALLAAGGERWALLRNALHFLTEDEAAWSGPSLALDVSAPRGGPVVRLTARRADAMWCRAPPWPSG